MGARDLLADLADAGVRVAAERDRLVVRPASRLTDDMRAALRVAKPELLTLLVGKVAARPYRLSATEADLCHADPWDGAACARFAGRVTRFLRLGIDVADADDLAERLHLRDLDGEDRRLCLECRHHEPRRCGNHKAAGLGSTEVGRDFAAIPQRCPGFETAR